MANIAKIQLTIRHCSDCPYAVKRSEYAGWFCIHDMQNVGLSVGDGQEIPDFCPFVLSNLQHILDDFEQSNYHQAPSLCGQHFLEDCISLGLNSPDFVQKQTLLLKIALLLQYNFYPADQHVHLKKLQDSTALSPADTAIISRALSCLTAPSSFPANLRPDKDTLVSAALVLTTTLKKTLRHSILSTKFVLYQRPDGPARAELHYTATTDLDLTQFASESPELISIPRQIACTFLGVPQLHFFVNDTEVELAPLLGN